MVLALGRYAEENSADILKLGKGITGSIAQSGIAEVVKDVELDPRALHVMERPTRRKPQETMMVAPWSQAAARSALSVYKDRNRRDIPRSTSTSWSV